MKVAVVMGSKSDYPVLESTVKTLEEFGVDVEARVISAHRSPDLAGEFAKNAAEGGVEVIIAAAGKAAHLAGVMAGHSVLPVIGLPVKSSLMDGLDSLLSTVQMPEGVPVAAVAVNGGKNAALLAVQILAVKYVGLREKLAAFKREMRDGVVAADAQMRRELNKEG
jgi:5-(carboxyamino)imidazole ribonucleotide mutase